MSSNIKCPRQRRSVLIVEDEVLVAMSTRAILEDAGYIVIGISGSVEQALDILKTERPDAAVLDGDLRGRMVTPVAERLESLSVPFVLASACPDKELAEIPALSKAENLGKPTDEARLLDAIQRLARRNEALVRREPRRATTSFRTRDLIERVNHVHAQLAREV